MPVAKEQTRIVSYATIVFADAPAAGCAFMTPIATPPHAIVFSFGCLHVKDMVRAGLLPG